MPIGSVGNVSCNDDLTVLYSDPLGKNTPWRPQMLHAEDKANYFRQLLAPGQQDYLDRVRQVLEVPCPHPTQEELEEAENAERS